MTNSSILPESVCREDDYWVHKLLSFKHGVKLFPPWLRGDNQGCAELAIEIGDQLRSQDPALYLSALALLLCRYTSSEELVIASPGPLFFHCTYSEDWSGSSFRHRVRAEIDSVRSRQAYSFSKVAARLAGYGYGNVADLFQVAFVFESGHQSYAFDYPPSLLLSISHGGGIKLCFDRGCYPTDFMRQFAGHYVRILEYLVHHPDRSLRDLELLSDAERATLVHGFNPSGESYAEGNTLHGLFEAQVVRTPDALAVVYQNKRLTYRALNESANRLAHYLSGALGIRNGDLVGVLTGRSENMIIALLAVLKTGAGYVPIHPKHPWDTVDYMIEDARLRVLLINSDTAVSVAAFRGELFVLDIELDQLTTASSNPAIHTDGGDLAYAIYTSGSTGRPKGVMVEHRAITNTVLWRNAYYGIDGLDCNLQMPSFSFDSSVVDIFCFLAAGASLVIPDEESRLDPGYLVSLIKAAGISRFIVTSSYYKVLVNEMRGLHSLRSITVAGESTTPDLVADHYRNLPGVLLINEYGPTENAVCSTACELHSGDASVSIGHPISNVKVFVVDERMRLTPVGVSGEVLLGGMGLARGYLNRPELTAEKFISSPIPDYYRGRLYRTGDRACWRPDGMLEFQGRIDRQVKIRGFRIELGEIEATLSKHPGCDAAVVFCKLNVSGEKYLAAYVASTTGVKSLELADYLRSSVPYYMVPDVLSVMPELPLNLNGKVDASYLSSLDDFQPSNSAPAEPHSLLEGALSGLCASVFKRPLLGVEDNFFALGANSLSVMELITKVRNHLDIGIELPDVYAYPTIRELARKIGGVPRFKAETAQVR